MPNNELEWILLYIGLGYVFAAATAASAIFSAALKRYADRGALNKFLSTVFLLFNFLLLVIALGHVLPLIFAVSDSRLADTDYSNVLIVIFGITVVFTFGCVVYSLHYLNQLLRGNERPSSEHAADKAA